MPALSSNELWSKVEMGFGVRYSFCPPALWLWIVTLTSMGFSWCKWKVELGIGKMGVSWNVGRGRVTKRLEWQELDNASPLPSLLSMSWGRQNIREFGQLFLTSEGFQVVHIPLDGPVSSWRS